MTLLRLGALHQVSRSAHAMQALLTLPEYCQLGLITFGTHVHVHELGFQEFSKAIVFQVWPCANHGPWRMSLAMQCRQHTPYTVCDACGVCPGAQLRCSCHSSAARVGFHAGDAGNEAMLSHAQGSKEYSPQQIAQHLGFGLKSTRSNATHLQVSH